MLDGILGRGFGFKCKSLIKAIRVRLAVIRRRAEAKQRFLKEDLANLLANGLDINAYGRTEEFLAGSSILWSYDFIEKSCECVVKQLSRMDKQGDCPEECRESIASLMFAAARFSDFPELRDLRDIFQQRFGSCLQAFVSRTFNEKLSSIPPDPVKRLQVLHDITSEFSIKWDSKGFEQRMGAPSVLVQVDFQKINGKQWDGFLDMKNTLQRPGEGNTMSRNISADCKTVTRESVKQRQKSPCKREECNLRGDEFFRRNQNVSGNNLSFPVEKYEEKFKSVTTSNLIVQGDSHIEYARYKNGATMTGENSEGNKHSSAIVKGYTAFDHVKSSYSSNKKNHDGDHLVYKGHINGIDNSGKGERSEVSFGEKDDYDSCFAGHRRKTNYSSNSSDRYTQSSLESEQRKTGDKLITVKSNSIYPRPPPYVKDKDPISRPPPYTKPAEDKQKSKTFSTRFGPDFDENFVNPSIHDRGNEVLRAWEILSGRDPQGSGEEITAMGKIKSHGHDKVLSDHDDKTPFPKPRSISRKHHTSSSVSTAMDENFVNPSIHDRSNEVLRAWEILSRRDHQGSEEEFTAMGKIKSHGHDKVLSDHDDKTPLTKPRSIRRKHHKSSSVNTALDENFVNPSIHDRGNEVLRAWEILSGRDHQGSEGKFTAMGAIRSRGYDKVLSDHDDKTPLPKPRSIRRKHHKSSSANSALDNCEDGAIKRSSNSRRNDHSKKGLQMMFDEEHQRRDEEEILMDKLLIHYSKKPSNYDVERKKKVNVPTLQQTVPRGGQPSRASEVVPMPSRSVSLHHDQVDSPLLNRSNTFQPDNQARHVHPKLPDYDELAAQFASLRGR